MTNRVRRQRSPSRWCQYWKAILSAISTAADPDSEKNTRSSPGGAIPASRPASSAAAGWVSPSMVECPTRSSWSRIASSISGWPWPCTLHHRDETPSM